MVDLFSQPGNVMASAMTSSFGSMSGYLSHLPGGFGSVLSGGFRALLNGWRTLRRRRFSVLLQNVQ